MVDSLPSTTLCNVQDAASIALKSITETAPTWQQGGPVPAQTDCAGSIVDGNVHSLSPAIYRMLQTADLDGDHHSRRGTLGESVISGQFSFRRERQESTASGKDVSFRSQSGQNAPV